MSDATGSIADIFVYPIKSCAAVRQTESVVTTLGLVHDRQWMIVDDQGRFQTQRQIPHLAWIEPQLTPAGLRLEAPNQPPLDVSFNHPVSSSRTVRVWNDTLTALDMGQPASDWLQAYLEVPGRQFHLVQFDPAQQRQSDPHWTGNSAAFHQFADGFAVNVVSSAAVQQLNERLNRHGLAPVDIRRFRPNLVLDGVHAHEEDHWRDMTIMTEGGQVQLSLVKPCPRCVIPDIDPDTAIAQPEITDILAQYRRLTHMAGAICFGMNAVVRGGAGLKLRPGQRFEAHMAL